MSLKDTLFASTDHLRILKQRYHQGDPNISYEQLRDAARTVLELRFQSEAAFRQTHGEPNAKPKKVTPRHIADLLR